MAEERAGVWVFMGLGAEHPAAVFTTRERGEAWVLEHGLAGSLTWYPLDISVYDWVIGEGKLKPKPGHQTPKFRARFSSAYQPHHHYENDDPFPFSDDPGT